MVNISDAIQSIVEYIEIFDYHNKKNTKGNISDESVTK